ncbi:MAG TPA: hypothetical protein VKR06_29775, partial [Ktedonosporobacter sp.]|nr:hypothetical protein [Ktedonosporobacter sp.]
MQEMLLQWSEGKRIFVTKGMAGAGKTKTMYLLLQRIGVMEYKWPMYYSFPPSDKTSIDQLDTFLSQLYTDLQLPPLEEEHVSRDAMIENILVEMKRCSEYGVGIAILLDDLQTILDQEGDLPEPWQEFLDAFVQYKHSAVIYIATREWPQWHSPNWSFLKVEDLPKLSADDGIAIWKRCGFDDVYDGLLREASQRCDGNPQLIELCASTFNLPTLTFLWPRAQGQNYSSETANNQHVTRIKRWLQEETIFDPRSDFGVRKALTRVISRQLPGQAQEVMDLLAVSHLSLPIPLLAEYGEYPEYGLHELLRCSLLNKENIEQGYASLAPLAREARLQMLSPQRKEEVSALLVSMYSHWLYDLQTYQDDAEQGALIAELIIFHIKHRQFLKAAELLITYGWLCSQLGHMERIARYIQTSALVPSISLEEQAGYSILTYQSKVSTGQHVSKKERYSTYKGVYEHVQAGRITLQPHTAIHLAHEMMIPEISTNRYEAGKHLLDETLERIAQANLLTAEVRASWNQSAARLRIQWARTEEKQGNDERATILKKEAIELIKEGIDIWEECLAEASPLYQKVLEKRLGMAYNTFAYRLRLLGNIPEAEKAIRRALEFKRERRAARSRSVAVCLGEYALILAAKGMLQQALIENSHARDILFEIRQKGDMTVSEDLGMLLVEFGHILMNQARTVEAKTAYKEGISLIANNDYRKSYREEAQAAIDLIDATPHYYLDTPWVDRYLQLASYDDTEWLSAAGSFTDAEQQEWNALFPCKHEPEARTRMNALMLQSRQREIEQSLNEQREPCLCYPTIVLDIIRQHRAGFEQLLADIT